MNLQARFRLSTGYMAMRKLLSPAGVVADIEDVVIPRVISLPRWFAVRVQGAIPTPSVWIIGKPVESRCCPRNGSGTKRSRRMPLAGRPGRCRERPKGQFRSPETSLEQRNSADCGGRSRGERRPLEAARSFFFPSLVEKRSSRPPIPRLGWRSSTILPVQQRADTGIQTQEETNMSRNRGVVYMRPGKVEVRDIDDPKLEAPNGRRIEHGVILKVISTNICGSGPAYGARPNLGDARSRPWP